MCVTGYWCAEKSKVCPNANDRGFCNLSACCDWGSTKTITQTITLNTEDDYNVGRACEICGNGFNLNGYSDGRHICPECIKRLKELLYDET